MSLTSVTVPNSRLRHRVSKQVNTDKVRTLIDEDTQSGTCSSDEQVVEYANDEGIFIQVESSKGETTKKSFVEKHELPRKAFHSSTGLFTLWLYVNGYSQRLMVKPMIVMAVSCFLQDFIRFRVPSLNAKLVKLYSSMMRESEVHKYNGILFFLVGLIITSSLLPKDICLMCNLLLSWGDTSASMVGREFGKYTPKLGANKSLAGCIASFLTGLGCCYLLYAGFIPKYHHLVDLPNDIMWSAETSRMNMHCFALASGLIASVSEFIDLWGMDDNFTIPVLSGGFLYGLVYLFQI